MDYFIKITAAYINIFPMTNAVAKLLKEEHEKLLRLCFFDVFPFRIRRSLLQMQVYNQEHAPKKEHFRIVLNIKDEKAIVLKSLIEQRWKEKFQELTIEVEVDDTKEVL